MASIQERIQFKKDFPELTALCRILDKALADEKYYTQWFLDQVSTLEYDTEHKNLIVSFDKTFLQTFRNKFLLDIDKYSPSSDFELEYFDKELRYKVYEATLADRNIVKIAFKAPERDFRALNTLAWYVYSKYNYGPLHYRDKRDVKGKGLRFKVHQPKKYAHLGLKEWAVERVSDSYYDETDRVFYKDYEDGNTGSDAYIADIEWYNKFRYKPHFYKRFAPENCSFNKGNLYHAIVKKVAKEAKDNGFQTIVKENGVAICSKRKHHKVTHVIRYDDKKGELHYLTFVKKCKNGGTIRLKTPKTLSLKDLRNDYHLEFIDIYETLGLF